VADLKEISFGIDVGKRHDPTAIVVAVAEDRRINNGWETHFVIPFLKRLELNTPYPQQAAMLVDIGLKALHQFFRAERVGEIRPPKVYVDVTGVGDALVDLLKKNDIRRVGSLRPCRFMAGDRFNDSGAEYTIGKAHFASRLQILAESKRIHLPDIPEAQTLAEEMLDFDIDVDETSGKATFGAIRPGTHDDQVCALGLACLIDNPRTRSFKVPEVAAFENYPSEPGSVESYLHEAYNSPGYIDYKLQMNKK